MRRPIVWLLLVLLVMPVAAQDAFPTITPAPPVNVVVVEEGVVRGGPGESYLPVGRLDEGRVLTPVNMSADGLWVLIRYGRGTFAWVRRDLVFWADDVDALPVLEEDSLTPTVRPGMETATPFLFPTPTPAESYVRTEDQSFALVRSGPGELYPRLGRLAPGTVVEPVGQFEDGTWILIRYIFPAEENDEGTETPEQEGFAWIARGLVEWQEEIDDLPVLSEDNLTPTATFTPTFTPTPTSTASPSPTSTPTRTPSLEPTDTPTSTVTPSPEPTDTPTDEPTLTQTPSPEPTNTAMDEPTSTVTPSLEPTDTATDEPMLTRTPSPEPTDTATDEPTATATEEPTLTQTPSPEPTDTPTDEPTLTQTPSPEPTATATDEPTATLTPSPEPTDTPTDEPTSTVTPSPEPTTTATDEPTDTATVTVMPSPEPTATSTDEPTVTPSPEPTATTTDEPTSRASQTPLVAAQVATESPSSTATNGPTLTSSPEPSATTTEEPTSTVATESPEPSITATQTPEPTRTPIPAVVPPPNEDGDTGGVDIPPEAVVGGVILLVVLAYVGLYLRGLSDVDRYATGFVIETCPVCQQGHVSVEIRVTRWFGIPRARRTVRCDKCRSVLRETDNRRWRYAVDPMANSTMYERYNGREFDEARLVKLRPSDQTPTPPSFVDDE